MSGRNAVGLFCDVWRRNSDTMMARRADDSIGGHFVKRLKNDGFWVRRVDLKFHEFFETTADDFVVGDSSGACRNRKGVRIETVPPVVLYFEEQLPSRRPYVQMLAA
jgi:hypothetical protein